MQDLLVIQQARNPPCGELPYAVACNHEPAWHLGTQNGPGRHGLGAAQDLPNLVRMEIVVASIAHQSPRIFAIQNEFRGFEHWARFRRISQEIKHGCALIALAGAKDSHGTHEWASRLSRKSVIANRSAQPPGLRRRTTKAWCTATARSRQSACSTPPCSRKRVAASWA